MVLSIDVRVRLRNGPTYNQGRVEVLYQGRWGTICDNDFDIEDANVICRMAGFEEGAWSTQCCHWYGSGRGEIWLDGLDCEGTETSIANCSHRGWGQHDCSHREDVGVECRISNTNNTGK